MPQKTLCENKRTKIKTLLTANPISIFSPTEIWILSPNRAFIPLSLSLFISWVCTSYSINGRRLLIEVALASAWAFFFRRHNLMIRDSRWHQQINTFNVITGYFPIFPSLYSLIQPLSFQCIFKSHQVLNLQQNQGSLRHWISTSKI